MGALDHRRRGLVGRQQHIIQHILSIRWQARGRDLFGAWGLTEIWFEQEPNVDQLGWCPVDLGLAADREVGGQLCLEVV